MNTSGYIGGKALGSAVSSIWKIGTETGVVTYDSSSTLVLTGSYPAITNDAQIAYVKIIPSSGQGVVFYNAESGITLRHSGGVITITGASPFQSGDSYEVGINAPRATIDYDANAQTTNNQNEPQYHEADAQNLVSASDIGATDDTWVDQGAEIDCSTFHDLVLFVNLTVNDSTGNYIRLLAKTENGGTDEYESFDEVDYVLELGDADRKVKLPKFDVSGVPYVQVQTKATDVDTGGGTEGTVSIEFTLDY